MKSGKIDKSGRVEKILCLTPTPDKQGTRIPRWKYDLIHDAILEAVQRSEQGVEFKLLPDLVKAGIASKAAAEIGSILWHVVTVKLHMEVTGELERVPKSSPQRIRVPLNASTARRRKK